MNTTVIEVFIETNCRSCEEVLRVVRSLVGRLRVQVRVYDRQADKETFSSRSVMVCPATFVNNRLTFYGSFTGEELAQYLESQQSHSHK